MGKITSKEIAKLAGVSVSAVSIVLNNKPGVSDETRKRVLHILAENGILPRAANLVEGSKGIIRFCKVEKHGGILNDRHNVFISDYIDGVVEEAKNSGCVVEFESFTMQNFAEIEAKIRPSKGLLGCIILATELSQEDIERFTTLKVPCLFLDAIYDFYPALFVTMDNLGMVYDIIKHLKACGHDSIGMLVAGQSSNFAHRQTAFRLAMEDLGLNFDESLIFSVRSTHTGSYEDMVKILKTIDRKTLPSALFACNDMVAIGAMRALQEAGIQIPNDISLVGFDDLPAATFVSPPLSSVYVPKYEIGCSAVDLLLKSLEYRNRNHWKSQKVVLGGSLVERASVKNKLTN